MEKSEAIDERASLVRAAYMKHFDKVRMFNMRSSKSAQLSENRRLSGNVEYSQGKYEAASELYTEAILIAPPGSHPLKLAFGNRSACHFALGLREQCIKDIERALAMDCGRKLREKLEKRKAAALNLPIRPIVEEAAPFGTIPSLNPEIPCASDAVTMVRSEEWGWHMVAARDVRPGETLVYERSYITQLSLMQRARRCYECCALARDAIPCLGCNRAIFCDEECRSRSLERGHRFECPLMEILATENVSLVELCSLRMALRARCEASSWSQLRLTVRSCDSVRTREDNRFVYDPDSYTSVLELKSLWAEQTSLDLDKKSESAAAFLHMLMKHSQLFFDVETPNDIWFFGGLLLLNTMICATNGYDIQILMPDDNGYFTRVEKIGSELCLLLSRVNHSCTPNVMQATQNKMTALVALRPLKKGQQMFISYGPSYESEDIHKRQKLLLSQYKFLCQCRACADSWPLHMESATKKHLFVKRKLKKVNQDSIKKLIDGNKAIALTVLPHLYKNAVLLESHAPCQEFSTNQELIRQCLRLFSKF